MCPGRPPARRSTSSAPASIRSIGPSSSVGSRLPWMARSCPMSVQASSSGIRQSAPTTSPPASAISGSRVAVPVPKWIVGTPVAVEPVEDAPGVRQDELAVVRRAQRSHPRVEQLHDVGARLDLRHEVLGRGVGQQPAELVPRLRVAVHQRLGVRVVVRVAAFDRVGRQRERGAGEADQGDQVRPAPPSPCGWRRAWRVSSSRGSKADSARDVRLRSDRTLDLRPFALDEVEAAGPGAGAAAAGRRR